MSMSKISNNPRSYSKVTEPWIFVEDCFTEEEVQKIQEYCSIKKLDRASTVGSDSSSRVSNNCFNDIDHENQWFIARINQAIEEVNQRFYGFDLYGYSYFQYAEYEGSESGKYDAHTDLIFGENKPEYMIDTRKLSLSLLLSEPEKDFIGGEFFVHLSGNPSLHALKKGQIIVFPSFMLHGVKPVLSGVRKSIVIWVEGPKFK
jgi:PKHD-type hydroxylase